MKILVVDDLKVDRYVIKKELQTDFQVTTLSSAREALAFAQSHVFEVALINVMLEHDLDGIELLKNLRHVNRFNFLAIAITCYIDQPRHDKVLRAGFESVMIKPFDKNNFLRLVFQKSAVVKHY
jgi:CheY-like chemotaxis protein